MTYVLESIKKLALFRQRCERRCWCAKDSSMYVNIYFYDVTNVWKQYTIYKKKQVNKNILEKLVAYRLKDNGGVKSTETRFDWNGTG